jgi:O-acetyl-ADP-ribose deacetylase (regulator of RNase III)
MSATSRVGSSAAKSISGGDPVETILSRTQSLVLEAIEKGWNGPPFDPFALADILKIETAARGDIDDARIVPGAGKKFLIEFNPTRPRARIRFSIAHEIIHTLFPDCAEHIRNRARRSQVPTDEWQLEMLCNLGAAELLMPIGSFPQLRNATLDIDSVLRLRKEYDVSVETVLLRATRLTAQPCLVFAASRPERERSRDKYRFDYVMPSSTWPGALPRGHKLSDQSVIAQCTAIGFTGKGDENLPLIGKVHVECVGIPPFPGRLYPRVAGLAVSSNGQSVPRPMISYLKGDATQPRGQGFRIIAHIVNDKTPNWGGGFALVLKKTWPEVQRDFQNWVGSGAGELRLGNIRFTSVNQNLGVVSMISQHGYGPSSLPRVRYNALKECLGKLADLAIGSQASVHMPRIGCGQAGGEWSVVSELIEDTLCKEGVEVTIYDLP